jgi:hypothetical protein
MVSSSELQTSWTLPCYRTLPAISSAFAVQQKACKEAFKQESEARARWEAEGLAAVVKQAGGSSSSLYCPYHESTVAWWWRSKCGICGQVYAERNAGISSDLPQHQAAAFTSILGSDRGQSSPIAEAGHPDHRLMRVPIVTAYTARRDRMPPEDALLPADKDEKRLSRRARACEEFPYNVARKGTDTTMNSFTGRTLMLKRSALGRVFAPLPADKQAWH